MSKLFSDYPDSVLKRFKKFHQENPHVYKLFKDKSNQIIKTGRKKYSARTIFESIRWDYDISTSGDVFEINGDFVPIYSRLLIHNHSEFISFFELRKIRSRGIKSEEQVKREKK